MYQQLQSSHTGKPLSQLPSAQNIIANAASIVHSAAAILLYHLDSSTQVSLQIKRIAAVVTLSND